MLRARKSKPLYLLALDFRAANPAPDLRLSRALADFSAHMDSFWHVKEALTPVRRVAPMAAA